MIRLRDMSIRRQLTLVTMLISGVVLLLTSIAFMAIYLLSFKQNLEGNLSINARIAGINCASAMVFNDANSAEQTLAALKAQPSIVAAFLFTGDDVLFAAYYRDGYAFPPAVFDRTQEGHFFQDGHLNLWKKIELDGNVIGTIYLKSDLNTIYRQVREFALAIGLILLVSTSICFLLVAKFQRVISAPILSLAGYMKRVSTERDYSLRMISDRKDELNLLITGFNDMLEQIKTRDQELKAYGETLEEKVALRTRELSKANQDLEQLITDLTQAKQVAEQANLAKSDFLANMSHELRTPLNHILGFTELVVGKNFGELNEIQEEYLNDVLNSGQHLLSLINDILDLSKVEAGKLEIQVADIDLRMLLENSTVMVKEKALKHNLHLCVEIDPALNVIQADERKLKQILYNLLSNAVKFTPDGGRISLTAEPMRPPATDAAGKGMLPPRGDGDRVRITVTDSGIGLDGQDTERIFDPFEQVDTSRSRKYQGTGLGLSMVKNLVELHGGNVWATSEGRNRGSEFVVVIPMRQAGRA